MKSQDIVILLKLASLQENENQEFFNHGDFYSVRTLESSLGISKTEIGASLKRSRTSGLIINNHISGYPMPHPRDLYNFIVNGLKFVFPASPGQITRGIATAFSAPMLCNRLINAGENIYVWPFAEGREKGQSVNPLFKSVPNAIQKDEILYEYLALVDAIRLGNQREAGLARELLEERLMRRW